MDTYGCFPEQPRLQLWECKICGWKNTCGSTCASCRDTLNTIRTILTNFRVQHDQKAKQNLLEEINKYHGSSS